MNIKLAALIERWEPDRRRSFRRRPDSQLSFLPESGPIPDRMLYDTTVYIDTLQARIPEKINYRLSACDPWHSTVVESELVYLCGRLDPAHPETARVIQALEMTIGRWSPGRVLNPGRQIWREAAILTGLISRLHRSPAEDRGRLMNDALIYLTGVEHECTLLTRNLRDFDLLMQIVPEGQVLFYRSA